MNSKTLNIFIAIFIIFSLVISVGAEGNIRDSSEEISIEKIDGVVAQESVEQILNHISEESKLEGERIESITPEEEATSENWGANPGQEEFEEASLSSPDENAEYVPLEEVLDETSSSPNYEENETSTSETNETKENDKILFNESQGQKEGSGQEETEVFSGQKEVPEINQTTNQTKETGQTTKENKTNETNFENSQNDNYTDVRGNTQSGTGSSSSSGSGTLLPVSLSSLNKDQEGGAEYISLSEIINETDNQTTNLSGEETNDNSKNDENFPEKKLYSYYTDGKKTIEIETFKEVEINKEEIEKNEFEKRVIISSEEHVENPLRVYVDMPSEVLKNQIKVFWENENLEITDLEDFSVKYYDENDNGLVDRISWIVPHLSEQIFEIVIEPEFKPGSGNIKLNVSGPEDEVSNPIIFNIEISNETNVECILKIEQDNCLEMYDDDCLESSSHDLIHQEDITEQNSISLSLPDFTYEWKINCSYSSEEWNFNVARGNFSVNEGFSIKENGIIWNENEEKIYFLDLVEDEIQNSATILVDSEESPPIKIEIFRGNNLIKTINGDYISLNESILTQAGEYNLNVSFDKPSAKTTLSRKFSVVSANLNFDEGTYDVGEQLEIQADFSEGDKVDYYWIDLGEGEKYYFPGGNDQAFYKSYEEVGIKKIFLNVTLKNEEKFVIEKDGILVQNSKDTSPPDITLDYPKHNSLVKNDTIFFEYRATDNVKVQNCTFILYNVSKGEVELYTETKTNVKHNEKIEVKMKDFDNGDYEWEVKCYDNSSNMEYDFNLFEVYLGEGSSGTGASSSSTYDEYDQQEEVDDALGEINAFLIDIEDFDADQKEVLEDLGISEEMNFFKKRLLQIDLYFKENRRYVDTESLKKQKDEEYLEEFENIKNGIPEKIEVIDTYEYVKNSVEIDLQEIVENYMKSTNTKISNSLSRKLAKMNSDLQQEVSVEADIKEVEITYGNHTDKFILVKKKIDLKNEDYNQILEIIPKEIVESSDEVLFLVDRQVIKEDPIFEILYEDLTEDSEIIYYILDPKKSFDLKDFAKTETILFEDSFKEVKAGVTGFFSGNIITDTNPIYFALILLLLIVLIILILFVFSKYRTHAWKKEPNVVKCFDLLRQANLYIKEKDVERARENYREIRKIYPVLPPKPKSYFYDKIRELSLEIDKRDIFGLVKEYENAKKHWNKEDCLRIYKNIKKVYERLPIKYRQKIYERINSY